MSLLNTVSFTALAVGVLTFTNSARAQGDIEVSDLRAEPTESDANTLSDQEIAERRVDVAQAATVATDGGRRARGGTDHSKVVGDFAIGYLGFRQMGFAEVDGDLTTVSAPVIGVRYWLDPLLGIDAGLGLLMSGGSTTDVDGEETDDPGPTVFIVHAGVPLALMDSEHFVFQVVPEVNVGLAGNTVGEGATETKLRGFHFDIGARAGAEIHFGFIDLPQLSLQAGIGLSFSHDSVSAENTDTNAEPGTTLTTFGTSVGDNPWQIFSTNIAAFYYFDR